VSLPSQAFRTQRAIGRLAWGLAALVACTSKPAVPREGLADRSSTPGASPSNGASSVCSAPWALGVVGGAAQVVVMCPSDVRREPLDPNGPLAPSLAAGLDPARERVCQCAAQLPVPPFVDLVFTAKLDEGRVTVEAKNDDDLDPAAGPRFVECIGTVTARSAPMPGAACGAGAPATLVYPVRVDLAP
jgi:hypothetical protein